MLSLNPLLWGAVLVVIFFGGEVARSIVDKRRLARTGFGGTGDIGLAQAALGYLVIAMILVYLFYRAFW
jgi:hypothetical protein